MMLQTLTKRNCSPFLTNLIVFALCITLSRAHCPVPPVYSQTTENDHQTFKLTTMGLCGNEVSDNAIEEINICDLYHLNQLLDLARYHIREAIDEQDSTVMMRRGLCNVHPMDIAVSSGHSVASTLRDGMSLLMDITLNLTIVSCHQHSRLDTNLFPAMQAIICEMKRLCSDLVQSGETEVQLDIESFDRTDLTVFTCRNLRRANTLIHNFKTALQFDSENRPIYGHSD